MRPCIRIIMTPEQKSVLTQWASSEDIDQRLALRAKVILLAAQGLSLKAIEKGTGLNWQSCLKWRQRFIKAGIDGLSDKTGRGRPQLVTPDVRKRVVALAATSPSDGSPRWTVRKLAQATGYSKSTIQQILAYESAKPEKASQRPCGIQETEFQEKRMAVIGLYLSLLENAVVLGVEGSSCSVSSGTEQLLLPMLQRASAPMHTSSSCIETPSLLSALKVHERERAEKRAESFTSQEFLSFLSCIRDRHPHATLHILVDNLASHNQKRVHDWVAAKKNVSLHYIPDYASWLNQMEICFSLFAHDDRPGSVPGGKQERIKNMMRSIRNYNQLWTLPFAWVLPAKSAPHISR